MSQQPHPIADGERFVELGEQPGAAGESSAPSSSRGRRRGEGSLDLGGGQGIENGHEEEDELEDEDEDEDEEKIYGTRTPTTTPPGSPGSPSRPSSTSGLKRAQGAGRERSAVGGGGLGARVENGDGDGEGGEEEEVRWRQTRPGARARVQMDRERVRAWHDDEDEDEDEDNLDEDQDDGRMDRTRRRPRHPAQGYDSASDLADEDEDDEGMNYTLHTDPDTGPYAATDDLSALPPELRARTAHLLARAQASSALSPRAELVFDTIIWTMPLLFVYVLLDVLVRQQYSQPVLGVGVAWRVASRGPFLGLISYYSLKHRSSPWIPYAFLGLSLGTGCGFLYVTAKSDFASVIRQTPALGALWVLSIVKLDLVPALLSLASVGAFVWALGLDLFEG